MSEPDLYLNNIINGTIKSIGEIPSKSPNRPGLFRRKFPYFSREDEKTLAEFLRQEENEKRYPDRAKENPLLVPDQDLISHPNKMIRQRIKYRKQEISMLGYPNLNWLHAPSSYLDEYFSVPKSFRDIFWNSNFFGEEGIKLLGEKMIFMRFKIYHLIVGYAKKIAENNGTTPVEAVKDAGNRDEIYKRIFEQREYFEWFHNTASHLHLVGLCGTYMHMKEEEDMLRDRIDRKFRYSDCRPELHMSLKSGIAEIPHASVIKEFFERQKEYVIRRAERIFSS